MRITKKNFQDKELRHELFLTTRQKTKIRNFFANNMLTNMKLIKAQLSKTIQSGEFVCASLGTFAGPLKKVAVPLAKKVLLPFATMASASATDGAI